MIEVKARGLDKAVKNIGILPKQLQEEIWSLVRWGTLLYKAEVMRLYSGKVVKVRSGVTRASITEKLMKARMLGKVGSKKTNMPLLEYGGTIRVKKAKLLTIPFPGGPALTAAGASRGTAREIGAMFESSFWMKSKAGSMILFGKTGKTLTPLFIGKKSVKIKARRPFELAQKLVEPRIHDKAQTAVAKLLDKVMR